MGHDDRLPNRARYRRDIRSPQRTKKAMTLDQFVQTFTTLRRMTSTEFKLTATGAIRTMVRRAGQSGPDCPISFVASRLRIKTEACEFSLSGRQLGLTSVTAERIAGLSDGFSGRSVVRQRLLKAAGLE